MDKPADYEVVIRPDAGWFNFNWKELFHYRDMLFLLVRRDVVAKYKRTILGPLWALLQPLLTTVVFTIIFKKIIRVPTDGIPPTLFYLEGLLFWSYFSQCLNGVATSLSANSRILSKVYFPRLIIPLSVVISNLITLIVQLLMLTGFYIYFKFFTQTGTFFSLNKQIIFFPLLVLQTAAVGLGIGLWIAALTVRYHDLHFAVGFFTQLWMYATPVIYPVSVVPEKWRAALLLNPMTDIIEFSRSMFFNTPFFPADHFMISAAVSALILFSGVLIFNKAERDFIDFI